MTAEEFLGIKDYLRKSLKIEWRKTIDGDLFVCLLLENEIISKMPFEQGD